MPSAFDEAFAAAALPTFYEQMEEAITYTPVGGAAVTRNVIVEAQPTISEPDELGEVEQREIQVDIRKDAALGVLAPAVGDSIIWDGRTFKVVEIIPDAGVGESRCRAVSRKVVQRHRDGLHGGGGG